MQNKLTSPKLSDEEVRYLNGKIEQLRTSRGPFKSIVSIVNYKTHIQKVVPRNPWVYVIDENARIIYVGSTGKHKRTPADRFRDLLYYNPNNPEPSNRTSHTLTYKLVKPGKVGRFDNGKQVREFYSDRCSVRYVVTKDVFEAKLIEDILIRKLKPSYND